MVKCFNHYVIKCVITKINCVNYAPFNDIAYNIMKIYNKYGPFFI